MKISYTNRTSPRNLHLDRFVYEKEHNLVIQKRKNTPRKVEKALTHQVETNKIKVYTNRIGKNIDVYV